jgi:hypothetical protein
MQRAMELKQKKNLDAKGNSFSVLQSSALNNIASNVNIKIGKGLVENNKIINELVQSEVNNFEQFVEENPDILLPTTVDVQSSLESDPLKESGSSVIVITPENFVKESNASMWTEVVKRGRNRNKIKKSKECQKPLK